MEQRPDIYTCTIENADILKSSVGKCEKIFFMKIYSEVRNDKETPRINFLPVNTKSYNVEEQLQFYRIRNISSRGGFISEIHDFKGQPMLYEMSHQLSLPSKGDEIILLCEMALRPQYLAIRYDKETFIYNMMVNGVQQLSPLNDLPEAKKLKNTSPQK